MESMESQNESVLPKNAPTHSINVDNLISMMEMDGWEVLYRNEDSTNFVLCIFGGSTVNVEFVLGVTSIAYVNMTVGAIDLVRMSFLIDSSSTENEVYKSCKRLYHEAKSASEEILNIVERISSISKDIGKI